MTTAKTKFLKTAKVAIIGCMQHSDLTSSHPSICSCHELNFYIRGFRGAEQSAVDACCTLFPSIFTNGQYFTDYRIFKTNSCKAVHNVIHSIAVGSTFEIFGKSQKSTIQRLIFADRRDLYARLSSKVSLGRNFYINM